VPYNTLARERLTGLLVCTPASGRPVKPCLDPWPAVFDFQVFPDSSTDPPPEPLPARWGLDDVFSIAKDMKMAPDDGARLQSYMTPPPGTYTKSSADFVSYQRMLNQNADRASIQFIHPADYDGTYVPSNSVRTVTPPDANKQLDALEADSGWSPPWAVKKGV
jgi:hypothetical protein